MCVCTHVHTHACVEETLTYEAMTYIYTITPLKFLSAPKSLITTPTNRDDQVPQEILDCQDLQEEQENQ